MHLRAHLGRRTYAEPGWVAIFAPGWEVELDQRSRLVLRRTFAELGRVGAADFWLGYRLAESFGSTQNVLMPAPATHMHIVAGSATSIVGWAH
jgi:hypothetical protein